MFSRATHFLMVKVIYNDRVPRLCPAVGEFVVHKGTTAFSCKVLRLFFQTTEVASVATMALQNGVDVKTVSSMLGHYSAGFTLDTYAHVTTDAQLKAAQTMGSILSRAV